MRKTFLFFITIIAVFAVWLFLMHTTSEQLSQSLPTINTNAPISSNTKPNTDVQETSSKTNTSDQSDQTSSAKENLKKSDAGIRNMLEARNHPVELWAKVVDQYSNSLSGVRVEAGIGHFKWPPEQYPNGIVSNLELFTDANGQFHVQDDSATGMGVVLQKDGYKQARNGYGSNIGGGSQENPVILTLWKLRGAEPLISSSIDTKIPHDGSSVTFDIASGKQSSNGDFRVTLSQYPLDVKRGWDRFNWSVKVEILNGGMREENEDYPFWAPTNGYQPLFEFNESSNAVKWLGGVPKKLFYIKTGQGQYGLMQFQAFPGRSPTGIQASFTINPSGSQNLEPDFPK